MLTHTQFASYPASSPTLKLQHQTSTTNNSYDPGYKQHQKHTKYRYSYTQKANKNKCIDPWTEGPKHMLAGPGPNEDNVTS